ncbi:hypothetical protein MNB_SM-3-1336 [hydrothermal vent metagenome]|uniref:Uncharacterized protein n=1 Tax=hydrothermal vent metagenome TaxID=652676 RepID=A0A1W1D593_9ZZZZ
MLDTIVLILFVLFMIFIFGNYHKTKSQQREEQSSLNKKEEN